MKHFFNPFKVLGLLLAILVVNACTTNDENNNSSSVKKTADYSASVALKWNNQLMEVERYAFAQGYTPPPAARVMAYMGMAAYEAAGPGADNGMPGYRSCADLYQGLKLPAVDNSKEYHWPTAINAAYNTMYEAFYGLLDIPSDVKFHTANLFNQLDKENKAAVPSDVYDRSLAFGKSVAVAVFDWSKTDAVGDQGYKNNFPSTYQPPVGPFLWKPMAPNFASAMLPQWGQIRRFAVNTNELKGLPPSYYVGQFSDDPKSRYYTQALEVFTTKNEAATTDYEQKWISYFWSDDIPGWTFTPSGRWFMIANQVIEREGSSISLEKALECYLRLGMALNDAGAMAWYNKYVYNVERPVTVIRRLMDPNWLTILNNPISGFNGITPPFPAYPSGHSTFGAAAAEVLTYMFGDNYAMTDNCHKERTDFIGTPRSFPSFRAMAKENAYSRIPLGVHFRMDCDEGVRLGEISGRRASAVALKK